MDGCRRVIISNSIFDTDDDAIVLKSTGAAATEDVVITNCIVSSYCNAIKAGTESTGGFKNISISNCVVKPSRNTEAPIFGSKNGITGVSLEIVDGGVMEGVSVSNISIQGTDCPLFVRLGNRARKHTENAPVPGVGKMRNIVISNIVAWQTGNYCSSITGIPGHYVENLSLSNIQLNNKGGLKPGEYIENVSKVIEDEKGYPQPTVWKELPSSGLFIRHAKNIQINGLILGSEETDPRIPVIADDVDVLNIQSARVNNSGAKVFFKGSDVRNIAIDTPLGWKKEVIAPVAKNAVKKVDICVYGGTSAGVIAAYAAKMLGKSVLLIEPGRRLGGLTSAGLGYTDIGNKYVVSGLSRDFYRRIGKHYGKFEQWIFEPHVAESLFVDYIKRAQVEVLYGYRISSATKQKAHITEIEVESASSGSNTIMASMFIDCSYEGDLMAKAGVSYTLGREPNSQYNESYNGVQLMHGHQFPDGVDPYRIPGDPSSGLLWGISADPLQPAGTGDKKIQAYNFRICLTDDPRNMVPVVRPDNYDSARYELLLRLFAAQPEKRSLKDYFIWSRMPNSKTDINNRGAFSTDMIGMNYSYPEAGFQERAAIIKEHEDYTKGLLYFFGHDNRVPESLRTEMLQWGYPRDEYRENKHWSPQLYVREVRRMVGDYVMTQANCVGEETVTDGVGMAAYAMDSHNCQRIVIEKDGKRMVKNEGNVEIAGFGPYPVSYRSLIPKASECDNLLVPVCLSASHIAYGSIRMEPVFMVLAQSAAVAASIAIDAGKKVQDVEADKVQAVLKNNPLLDGNTPEVLVDNRDKEKVTIKGEWKSVSRGGYGPDFLLAQSAEAGEKSVRFYPEIVKTGEYDIYSYYSKANSAPQTIITIHNGKKAATTVIKKEAVMIEGQTSGQWIHLGRFRLSSSSKCYIEISNKNATGNVAADAVLLLPL